MYFLIPVIIHIYYGITTFVRKQLFESQLFEHSCSNNNYSSATIIRMSHAVIRIQIYNGNKLKNEIQNYTLLTFESM
jgi:hypothetical protein